MPLGQDDRRFRTAPDTRLVLLGYQTTRLSTARAEVDRKRESLANLATREGFLLGRIFEENDVNRPCSALAALIAEARAAHVQVVGVATIEDLGLLPHVQHVTRERIEREAGVKVLIAETAP